VNGTAFSTTADVRRSPLRLALPGLAELAAHRGEVPSPAWIPAPIWDFQRLSLAAVWRSDETDLDVAFTASAELRRGSLFLCLRRTPSIELEVTAPGNGWRVTAVGELSPTYAKSSLVLSRWRATPIMPQPLPRVFTLQPHALMIVQIADLSLPPR
jgi:hypothetical protein